MTESTIALADANKGQAFTSFDVDAFEVPAGRAVYLQALDADGRLVQSMRTFVQAAPGTTRSCIGCHESKFDAAPSTPVRPPHADAPSKLQPESWGSGYVDYPGMIQPVLDRRITRPC